MLILSLILVFVILLIIYNVYEYFTHFKYLEQFEGQWWLPIIGNAHQFGRNPIACYNSLMRLSREYKNESFRGYIGRAKHLTCTNLKDVEAILSSTTLLEKAQFYDLLRPWLGEGLLTSSGAKWHKRRKMITPAFHFTILNDFLDVINDNTNNFVNKLMGYANNTTFDIQDLVSLNTLDIICETAMGVKVNALADSESKLVRSYHNLQSIILKRGFHPLKRFDTCFKYTADYQIHQKCLKEIFDFNANVIRQRKRTISHADHNSQLVEDGYFKRKLAFLDTLLTSTIDGGLLSDQDLLDEVTTFIFEGHDTTASGISFAIYCLSIYPEIQEKIFAEQCELFGDDIEREPTYGEIKEMKYLELFLKEVERLYPGVPLIGRLNRDFFNLNGRLVPPNTSIVILLPAYGRNPDIFDNPDEFRPERFLPENRVDKNPFSYVPFSAGPRNCIGQKFAMIELKAIISKLVQNFYVHPSSDVNYEPVLSAVLTLKSENGINIRLQKRDRRSNSVV